jgi:beta-galactosidase/beta-glucuronidase
VWLHQQLAKKIMRIIKSPIVILAVYTLSWAAAQGQFSLNSSPWRLAAQADVAETGEQISAPGYAADKWYPAVVPGTVLTTLVNNKVYPEPLYGENNRPDKIPESLCRNSYWYRTPFTVPASYAGRRVWLNFDGINYSAEVWVNGKNVGLIKGAFARGVFDITSIARPGEAATLAVRVSPQPNPGNPIEHTIAHGLGKNGGITAVDGATFLCTIGWDWIPGIRDRDTGIWQDVFLSATGPVLVQEPLVTSDLPLPRLDSADIKIQATLKNVSAQSQKGLLKGALGDIHFEQAVELEAHATKVVVLDSVSTPQLKIKNPKLWWPNGYGPQNLYPVHLAYETGGVVSDARDFNIGIRKITYTVPDTENLTLSVNGVRVVCKGGCWGMDEAMKRIPRERLEAQVRMHQQANYTMIRNWVGQSTSEDFYELCDQYGILLWDEFFQPNPGDGPNPTDLETYLANCREKIVRFRNHPSIAVWCGRNEGRPPENINNGLQKLMDELEPARHYQPSSTDGHGVHSGGPYRWRTPQEYYSVDAPFKTEIGSVSVPTLEAVQAMMPQKDWETINDDWVEHDLGRGAQAGDVYPGELNRRYGQALNLADFVRKAQLANYEAFRSMYEGRFARLFQPVAGVLTWMSNPAQPSFVWQLYSWDLEPNSSLFAARKACEPVHIMFNESVSKKRGDGGGQVQVINNLGTPLAGATASIAVYNLDGSVACQREIKVEAPASAATDVGDLALPAALSKVYFIRLKLLDAAGQIISENFYWRGAPSQEDDLQDLQKLSVVKLQATVKRHDAGGKCLLDVTLQNPSEKVALMTHLQLRRKSSGERVLPVYHSDNYISLPPQESKTVTIEAASADLHGDQPLVVLDGWNVDVAPVSASDCAVELNKNAQVANWPVTDIAVKWFDSPLEQIKIHCGALSVKDFIADAGYDAGVKTGKREDVDASAVPFAPPGLYQLARSGDCTYTLPMKPTQKGYVVRLYFAELVGDWSAKDAGNNLSGKRVFDVDINDQPALVNFDIYAAAGGMNKAVAKELKNIFPDKDGKIRIHFRTGMAGKPKINAIEVVPAG